MLQWFVRSSLFCHVFQRFQQDDLRIHQLSLGFRETLTYVFFVVECVVPGAGAVEIFAHRELGRFVHEVKGRARLGVQAFANALLVIPKVLAANAGHDTQETMVKLLEEAAKVEKRCGGNPAAELVGVDLATGEAMIPAQMGVYDNFIVKKQIISSCAVIASNILLVDEIMRAGLSSLKG
ncbi:hypothetical protein EG68_10211 [Paragonimus skrjabini miyazakii]|uniref:Uncharacterized protein n=1 Tax=Paragonimus skrjabini miyazakii TaxID=59628 RepID=A0A8S9YEV3_9TREM|nr:hypothetical protein EG68_10211 [Paragonimus skrjabini miyazakii]